MTNFNAFCEAETTNLLKENIQVLPDKSSLRLRKKNF